MSTPKLYGVNAALAETIHHDPNLSEGAKHLFKILCDEDRLSSDQANAFVELIRRNYLWIEDLGYWSVTLPDRRSTWTKVKEFFRSLIQRKPQP